MTKTYFSPMLSIVGINKHDIIVTSETMGIRGETDTVLAPDRDWDAGY